MQLSGLANIMPPKLQELFSLLGSQGHRVGLIGGVTRDYLLTGKLSSDIDCELRPIDGIIDQSRWDQLLATLKLKYSVELLPLQVIQIKIDDFEIDLNRPRLEHFNDEFHHKNFDVEFIADMDYQQGFKRRDFTINAIMLELYQGAANVIDPMGGLGHLNQKILEKCSDDFAKDPVRLLRALRFKNLLGFSFSPAIKNALDTVEQIKTSAHYFKLEFSKSADPLSMLWDFCSYDERFGILKREEYFISQCFKHLSSSNALALCQAVACGNLDQKIKFELCDLFAIGHSKILFVEYPTFPKNVLELDYKDNTFQEFINWIHPLIKRLPLKVVSLIIYKVGVNLDYDGLDRAVNMSIDESLDKIEPKLRTFFMWKQKLKVR